MGLQPQAGAKHVQGSHGKIGEGPGLQQLRDEDDDIRVQPAGGPGGGEQEQLSVLGQTLGQVQHGPPAHGDDALDTWRDQGLRRPTGSAALLKQHGAGQIQGGEMGCVEPFVREDQVLRSQPEIRGERSAGVALENGGSDGKLCHGRTWPFVGEVSSGTGFGSSWPVPGPGENRSPRGPGSLPAAPAGGALTGPR